MSGKLVVFSEADLQAFIDGQMAEDERESFLEFLVNNPEEGARVRAYLQQADALRHKADQTIAEPAPDYLSEIIARARQKK